jgi:hypothetical protein
MGQAMCRLGGPIQLTLATTAMVLPETMAQPAGEEAAIVATEMGSSTAPVTLDGKVLFRVSGISVYPAEQRARAIAERSAALAADTTIPTTALRTMEAEDRTEIIAGEQRIMGVFEMDARLEGVTRQLLAQAIVTKIGAAVQSYREERKPDRLLYNTLYALVATVLVAGLLVAIRWAFRRFTARIEQRYQARIQQLEAQSLKFVRAEQLKIALHRTLQTVITLVVLVLLYVYLHFVLSLYPWTRQFAEHLLTLLLNPLVSMGAGLLAAVPNLVFIAVLVVVTRSLLKLIRLFSEAVA